MQALPGMKRKDRNCGLIIFLPTSMSGTPMYTARPTASSIQARNTRWSLKAMQMKFPGMSITSLIRATSIVRGVFGWPAIHVRKGKDANLAPTLENIFIDVGAKDKKEVEELGIHVGCVITYDDGYEEINKKCFIGRALDNRLGGYCIAEVARKLFEEKIKLPYSLYVVNSVQEEVGLHGATMIAQTIRPDVAIITDVTHDTSTPLIDAKQEGDVRLGLGPALTYAPSVHRKLLQLIEEAAQVNNIPFQRVASSRSTGTDTDAFAYANGGIPSALISIPLRYMHTTVEMAHFEDISHLINLISASLQQIKSGHNFKYFDR